MRVAVLGDHLYMMEDLMTAQRLQVHVMRM